MLDQRRIIGGYNTTDTVMNEKDETGHQIKIHYYT